MTPLEIIGIIALVILGFFLLLFILEEWEAILLFFAMWVMMIGGFIVGSISYVMKKITR